MSETGDEISLLEMRYCPFSPTQLFWFSDRLLASELAVNPGLTCRVEFVLAVAQHQQRLAHAAFPQQHHLEGVGLAAVAAHPTGRHGWKFNVR